MAVNNTLIGKFIKSEPWLATRIRSFERIRVGYKSIYSPWILASGILPHSAPRLIGPVNFLRVARQKSILNTPACIVPSANGIGLIGIYAYRNIGFAMNSRRSVNIRNCSSFLSYRIITVSIKLMVLVIIQKSGAWTKFIHKSMVLIRIRQIGSILISGNFCEQRALANWCILIKTHGNRGRGRLILSPS